MQTKCQRGTVQSGRGYSLQTTRLLEVLPETYTGDLEVTPTDLRRMSATGGVSPLTVVSGGAAPSNRVPVGLSEGQPRGAGGSNAKLTISKGEQTTGVEKRRRGR